MLMPILHSPFFTDPSRQTQENKLVTIPLELLANLARSILLKIGCCVIPMAFFSAFNACASDQWFYINMGSTEIFRFPLDFTHDYLSYYSINNEVKKHPSVEISITKPIPYFNLKVSISRYSYESKLLYLNNYRSYKYLVIPLKLLLEKQILNSHNLTAALDLGFPVYYNHYKIYYRHVGAMPMPVVDITKNRYILGSNLAIVLAYTVRKKVRITLSSQIEQYDFKYVANTPHVTRLINWNVGIGYRF